MCPDEVLPATKPETARWNEAVAKVRDNLPLFSGLRGARVNASVEDSKGRLGRSVSCSVFIRTGTIVCLGHNSPTWGEPFIISSIVMRYLDPRIILSNL